MIVDISEKDKRLLNTQVVQEYKKMMIESIHSSFPGLNLNELDDAITWAIINRHTDHSVKLDNNYTKQTINGTIVDILRYIEYLEPVITSSGVLYKKHKEEDNPLSRMIQGFLTERKKFKKEMFKYPKGSALFEKYNLLQLLEKLNANATYGKVKYAA